MTGEEIIGNKAGFWQILAKPVIQWAIMGLIALVYLLNQSPFVSFHDSIGFLLDAETGFNPATNATSHLLYNNFQHLLVLVFSFLPPVLVLTLGTITCSLIALNNLRLIVTLLTGSAIAAILTIPILAFSFTWWQQSEIIEVYAFNGMLFTTFIFLGAKIVLGGSEKEGPKKSKIRLNILLFGLIYGLSLLTHIQNILAFPFFLFVLGKGIFAEQAPKSGSEKAARIGAFFSVLACFSVLLILPVTLKTHSIAAVFFDNHFQANILSVSLTGLLKGLGLGIGFLMYNFHLFLFFIIEGIILLWKRQRKLFWPLALLFLPFFGFGIKYNVTDNYVFYLSAYFPLVIAAGFSVQSRLSFLRKYLFISLPVLLFSSMITYAFTLECARRVPNLVNYDLEKAYKGGLAHALWPGKAQANDPLVLALEIYHNPAIDPAEIEWHYPQAIAYLRLKGKISP